jgi:hypothetical protein
VTFSNPLPCPDVRLESDAVVGDFSSTPFYACGELWSAKLEKRCVCIKARHIADALAICARRRCGQGAGVWLCAVPQSSWTGSPSAPAWQRPVVKWRMSA